MRYSSVSRECRIQGHRDLTEFDAFHCQTDGHRNKGVGLFPVVDVNTERLIKNVDNRALSLR